MCRKISILATGQHCPEDAEKIALINAIAEKYINSDALDAMLD
jgi:hypothetical protein